MWVDLLGKQFKDGGRGPDSFDCWGLTMELYFRLTGVRLPNYPIGAYDKESINGAYEQGLDDGLWIPLTKPDVPCIIAFRFNSADKVSHAGVYIGGGQFIHCREKTGVCKERLDNPAWRKIIVGYYIPGVRNEINNN